MARLAHRQIGGQTGDVSGAAQQVGEIAYCSFYALRRGSAETIPYHAIIRRSRVTQSP